MKLCLVCDAAMPARLLQCTACGEEIPLADGIPLYAPGKVAGGEGFRPEYFKNLAELEAENFWFRARNELLIWAIRKYCGDFFSFLEIGCGTGFVLSGIADQLPEAQLSGSELFPEGIMFAKDRVRKASFMQMDARNIPFRSEFDVIGAFDVLEHIKEDQLVLGQVALALKDRGYLALTVPQHAWLWSPTDEYACHERRYSAYDLHKKVTGAGFEIIRSTSFISILLPALMFSRLRTRKLKVSDIDPKAEFKISATLNSLLLQILRFELKAISAGINFPAGGSRLLIARKM